MRESPLEGINPEGRQQLPDGQLQVRPMSTIMDQASMEVSALDVLYTLQGPVPRVVNPTVTGASGSQPQLYFNSSRRLDSASIY